MLVLADIMRKRKSLILKIGGFVVIVLLVFHLDWFGQKKLGTSPNTNKVNCMNGIEPSSKLLTKNDII